MITLIAALTQDRAIGYRNRLLYYLPADLQRFKALTTGHTIIMGRRTFESLPKGALPNRRNIVLSRQELSFAGAERYASLPEALAHCPATDEIFIIGGASVYEQALPLVDRLCLTQIAAIPPAADTYFPFFSPDEWTETRREAHPADDRHPVAYDFVDYERRIAEGR